MEEFVKLKDITKVYHMGEVEIRAADNINFSIQKRRVCCNCRTKRRGKNDGA